MKGIKAFTIITIGLLIISGITTLVTFAMIAHGISDSATYDKVYLIAVISGIITFLCLVCICIRVAIFVQNRIDNLQK